MDDEISDASDGRFVSGLDELKLGNKVGQLDGNVKLMHDVANLTSTDIPQLLRGIVEERNRDPIFKFTWEKAIRFFKNGVAKGEAVFLQQGIPTELHIALICWAFKRFYKKFNDATRNLRTATDVRNYPCKNYFKLLLIAVARVTGKPGSLPTDVKLYRGLKGHFIAKVGSVIAFQQFASTSRSMDKALEYAGKEWDKRTLLVIEDMMMSCRNTAIYLGSRSCPNGICLDHIGPNNKEFLVWPWEVFTVTRVVDHTNTLRVIYLKA